MAKDVTAKQHYVPQTYLDSFADKKHKCYVYDKRNKTLFQPNIRNILAIRYFYDFPEELIEKFTDIKDTIDFQCLEHTLGRTVDSFWSNIVANIDNNYKWFSLSYPHHLMDVYRCVAIQLLRTPTGKEIVRKAYSAAYDRSFDNYDNILLTKEILNILSESSNSPVLEMLLQKFGHVCVGINYTSTSFLTNDKPVFTVFDYLNAGRKNMLYYPITPTRCLFLMKRHRVSNQLENVLDDIQNGRFTFNTTSDITKEAYLRETQITRMVNPLTYELSDSIVHKLNLLCFENANRFVVSSTEAFMNHL